MKIVVKSFPDHKGRPGKRGGSAPRGTSYSDTEIEYARLTGEFAGSSKLLPDEVKHIQYTRRKGGFVLQDIGGYLGHTTGFLGKDIIERLGSMDDFENFLGKYGASKIKPSRKKRTYETSYYD